MYMYLHKPVLCLSVLAHGRDWCLMVHVCVCVCACWTDDIEVIFFEEKHDNGMHPVQPWVAKGRFGPNDVHHQVRGGGSA